MIENLLELLNTNTDNFFINITCISVFISNITRVVNELSLIVSYILLLIGYKKYIIDTKITKTIITSNIINTSYIFSYDSSNNPRGLVIDKLHIIPGYIIYINQYREYVVYSLPFVYKQLIADNKAKENVIRLNNNYIPTDSDSDTDSDDGNDNNRPMKNYDIDSEIDKINYYTLSGSYGEFQYIKRNLYMFENNNVEMYPKQNNLFVDVMNYYKENKHCKILITGPPGRGKTFFSYILANRLKCSICDTYNPIEPSASIDLLYYKCNPTASNPLIIMLDEIDILLSRITSTNNTALLQHKHYPREIYDKQSWNKYFDKIDFGVYPYLFLILTSNKSKSVMNKEYGNEYLRDGRIDISCEF